MQWLFPSIYGAQVRHLGFWRATIGGLLMYASIPFFVLLHFILALVVMPTLMANTVGAPVLGDFIHYKRNIMDELNWFDRFNCAFCSWANGVVTYLNAACDHVVNQKNDTWSIGQRAALILSNVILSLCGLYITIIDRSIALFHRWSSSSPVQNWLDLRAIKYAAGVSSPFVRETMFMTKVSMVTASHSLRQIESRWCPIKYVEARMVPAHHDQFPAQMDVMNLAVHLAEHGKFG